MCVETCVKISDKSDEKLNKSYSLCRLSSWVMQGVYKIRKPHNVQGGLGRGYWSKLLFFFLLEDTSCDIPSMYVLCNAKQMGSRGRVCSVTHDT